MTFTRTANTLASPLRAFGISLTLGAAVVLANAAWSRHAEAKVMARIAPQSLSSMVDVTTQLQPDSLPVIRRHYTAVVDLRPDGEVAGQPASQEMEAAARGQRINFSYVPVPHGEIPENAVGRLRAILASEQGRVLLYCRSGRRAARTWALAEASRPGGLSTEEIIGAVRRAGLEVDDLRSRVDAAVLARGKVSQ